MAKVIVAEASFIRLPALRRLFREAVWDHFTYFPTDVQRRVISDHSLPKLMLATADPRRIILTAYQGGRLIGYCLGAVPKIGAAQIYWLFVHPDCRGNNVGLTLLSRMLRLLEARGADQVAIATHDHRHYYERQGFKYEASRIINGVNMDILTYRFGTS